MDADHRDNLKERCIAWLRESGWSVEDGPVDPQVIWAIKASLGEGLPVGIYQLVDERDAIHIQTDAQMAPPQIAQFNKMKRGREEFILDLQSLVLSQADVECSIEWTGYKAVVIDRIFLDGLTKDFFWRQVRAVRVSALRLLLFFHRKLGGPPIPAFDSVN